MLATRAFIQVRGAESGTRFAGRGSGLCNVQGGAADRESARFGPSPLETASRAPSAWGWRWPTQAAVRRSLGGLRVPGGVCRGGAHRGVLPAPPSRAEALVPEALCGPTPWAPGLPRSRGAGNLVPPGPGTWESALARALQGLKLNAPGLGSGPARARPHSRPSPSPSQHAVRGGGALAPGAGLPARWSVFRL